MKLDNSKMTTTGLYACKRQTFVLPARHMTFLCLRVMVTHEPSQVKLVCPQEYLCYTLHMPLQCSWSVSTTTDHCQSDVHTHMHTHTYANTHIHTYTPAHTHIHARTHTQTHTHTSGSGFRHITYEILSYIDNAQSLCHAEQVCRDWYHVVGEGLLWKKLIEKKMKTDSVWRGLSERRGWWVGEKGGRMTDGQQ